MASNASVVSKVSKEGAKRSKKERIERIRHYIHNERDSITLKWRSLEESLESEDNRRAQFVRRRIKEDAMVLPLIIRKFIGSLRKAVRSTMRIKGGTPYSIIHHLFIYWDSKKSGSLSSTDLENFLNSLGIRVTVGERQAILEHYDSGHGSNEMSYVQLLEDLQRGEPSVIEFVEKEEEVGLRFQEVSDDFVNMPDVVKHFLGAFRNYIDLKMTKVGGTPAEHVRAVFEYFDTDLTSGLDRVQLQRAATQGLKLTMTLEQASAIVKYYDRLGLELGLESGLGLGLESGLGLGLDSLTHTLSLSLSLTIPNQKILFGSQLQHFRS
jgi:Ca2+-binding EF-hand superfamily protein